MRRAPARAGDERGASVATKEKDLRAAIVAQCRLLSAAGLSPGTAGNISARLGEAMLITPASVPTTCCGRR